QILIHCRAFWSLMFGSSLEVGGWGLDVIFTIWSLGLPLAFPNLSHHRSLFHRFPILQLAANCFVAAGNDLLAFLQALDNLPMGIIADADLHWQHFGVVALEDKHHLDRLCGFFLFISLGTRGRVGAVCGRVRPGSD